MFSVLLKKKNAVILFGIGFIIGIILEINLVERGALPALYHNILGWKGPAEPKLACVIFVKASHTENLVASEKTWLTKCDEYIGIRVKRGKKVEGNGNEVCERASITNVTARSAWGGLCKTLRLMKSSECNWFILSPDNLLVLADNLKTFVNKLDWNDGHYFGHAISHYEADYNVLSAGVLLSRGSLTMLLQEFESEEMCEAGGKHWRNEDLYLGKYLKKLGVLPKDTRDENGRGRFHGYNINVLISPGKLFKQTDYSKKSLFPVPTGLNCCSPELITVDATNANRMYHHYFYIYKLGKSDGDAAAERGGDLKRNGSDWKDFLRGEGYNETAIENLTDEEYYKIWAKKLPPESLYELMRKEFGS